MSEIQRLVAEINAAGYQVFQLFQCENALHHWGCMLARIDAPGQIVMINRASPEEALKSAMEFMREEAHPVEEAEENLEDYL